MTQKRLSRLDHRPQNGTTAADHRVKFYLWTLGRPARGILERFFWCRCGDQLVSLIDRLTGRCWVCRSVR